VLAAGIYERTSGAAGQPLGRGYQRREPERTVLHELVARRAQTMLGELHAADRRAPRRPIASPGATRDSSMPRTGRWRYSASSRDTIALGSPVRDLWLLVGERLRDRVGSGYGQPNDRAQSQRAGFDRHLVKPVEMRRLLQSA
jgi:hypothetical protein